MEFSTLNTLRIGNYYLRKHRGGFTYEKISLDLLSRILSEDTSIAFNDFEAIGLTADWLINLGFKKSLGDTTKAEFQRISDDKHYSVVKLKSESELWSFMVDNIEIRNIEYVHDFQNIYFGLTNKELELTCSIAISIY